MLKNGLRIANINGSEILKINNGRYGELKYNCVISNSLLLDKVKELGLKYSKNGVTKQIINVCFDYGYKDLGYEEYLNEYNIFKNISKNIVCELNKKNKTITDLLSRVENHNNKIKEFKNEILKLNKNIDNKKINSINKKIINREEKIKDINEFKKNTYNELKKIKIKFVKNKLKELNLLNIVNNKISKKEKIRDKLYKEGFELKTYKKVKKEVVEDKIIKYHFWFRTAGKAKKGADYFIDEKLWKKIDEWQRMGIELPKENAKLVEMEVYKSLVSSAIEDYYICDPNEILVVNDLDCYSELQPIVSVFRDNITGYSKAEHKYSKCKNTIWDGMCLIQTENGSTGFRGLRHHMYKTGGFVADFQQYFKDYYGDKYETATIKDRYGRQIKVSTIKMITTENSMKWEKLLDSSLESFNKWANYVRENGCKFGVCKRDHKSKYGNKQRMSYQMINTLPLNKYEVNEIFNDSKEYIYNLQNNEEFLIKYMKNKSSLVNNYSMLIDIYNKNNNFINSYLFRNTQYNIIESYKESLKHGKILSEGDNETLIGNPYLLLEYITGQLDEYIKDNVISGYIDKTLPLKNSCYCQRFEHNEELGCFRSPHNSPNNILVFKNNLSEIMNRYFYCFGKNIIAVNFLYNDVQDRGNGLDTDLDFVFATNNKKIVEKCKQVQVFPTIVNNFKKSTKKYNNTMEDLAIIDNGLQASQKAIGTSSNVAQLYLSQYWHMINNQLCELPKKEINDYNYYFIDKPMEDEKIDKLLDNVCILSILAQVAVDSSKRAFEVGDLSPNALNKEIQRLRKDLPYESKPTFWQYTSSAFTNKEIENKLKAKYNFNKMSSKDKKMLIKNEKERMISGLYNYYCPVNNILKEIENIKEKKKKKKISDDKFIQLIGSNNTRDKKQARKIEDIINNFYNLEKEINKCYKDGINSKEESLSFLENIYIDLIEKVKTFSIKEDTMSLIIARTLSIDNKKLKTNKDTKMRLLNTLYLSHKDVFLKCFL